MHILYMMHSTIKKPRVVYYSLYTYTQIIVYHGYTVYHKYMDPRRLSRKLAVDTAFALWAQALSTANFV